MAEHGTWAETKAVVETLIKRRAAAIDRAAKAVEPMLTDLHGNEPDYDVVVAIVTAALDAAGKGEA